MKTLHLRYAAYLGIFATFATGGVSSRIATGAIDPRAKAATTHAARSPRVELDHVYIVVRPGAVAEIAALRSAGLNVYSEPRRHAGQGTASVSAYMENAYLELIWVDSTVAVTPDHAATHRWFRAATEWRRTAQSPFGIGLHRMAGDTSALPVPVKREAAPWVEPGAAYELLQQPSDSLAADFFVVPAKAAVPRWMPRFRERAPDALRHPGGGREITLVRLHGRTEHQPAALPVLRPARIQFERASEPLLEVYLDGGAIGRRVDLRPVLPLVLVR
jgi:hypothetical protein